ncbi:MAG: dTMP kinase [Alphaproteobacteria bacterium]
MTGRFITFEGGEGTGKSTQVVELAETLRARGIDVVVTREPGGTPGAEAIRTMILSGLAARFGPEGEALLFAVARADHVDSVIMPALAAGRWVICDRFIDSTRVYQGGDGGVDPAAVKQLETTAIGDLVPDLTIILDLPAAQGLARAAERTVAADAQPDRFERDGLMIHEQRRQAFLDIAAAEPERCVVIDANSPKAEVARAVLDAVESRLLAADS